MAVRTQTVVQFLTAAALAVAVSLPVRAQDTSQLVFQMQQLLEEVRELRGLVESQGREIENLRRRQRDQYLDLDQRLQSLGQGGSVPMVPPDPASSDAVVAPPGQRAPLITDSEPMIAADVPDVRAPIDEQSEITPLAAGAVRPVRDLGTPTEAEQAAYDRAFRALREQRFGDAAEGFSRFLDEYPDSGYAPNALYWLAETYYVTRDFETALRFFQQLRQRYPDSNKDGDALLKIGFSHFEQRQWTESRAALEQVRNDHAGTTLARLAETRLRDMRLAGHF